MNPLPLFLAAAEPTTHVVYRSRMEAEADAFWMDLMAKHPEAFIALIIVAALVVLGVMGVSLFKRRRTR